MAALTIASLDVPVKEAPMTPTEIGDTSRAFDGSYRSTVSAIKRSWAITTALLYAADASTLRTAIAPGAVISASGDVLGGTVSVYPRLISETPGGTAIYTSFFVFTLEEA